MRQGCRGLVLICKLSRRCWGIPPVPAQEIVGIYQRHDFANEKRAALEAWGKQVMALVEGGWEGVHTMRTLGRWPYTMVTPGRSGRI